MTHGGQSRTDQIHSVRYGLIWWYGGLFGTFPGATAHQIYRSHNNQRFSLSTNQMVVKGSAGCEGHLFRSYRPFRGARERSIALQPVDKIDRRLVDPYKKPSTPFRRRKAKSRFTLKQVKRQEARSLREESPAR